MKKKKLKFKISQKNKTKFYFILKNLIYYIVYYICQYILKFLENVISHTHTFTDDTTLYAPSQKKKNIFYFIFLKKIIFFQLNKIHPTHPTHQIKFLQHTSPAPPTPLKTSLKQKTANTHFLTPPRKFNFSPFFSRFFIGQPIIILNLIG